MHLPSRLSLKLLILTLHPRNLSLLVFAERSRIVKLHTMIVVRLQEVKDDEELCQISQNLSSRCFERAHTLAKAWIVMDK